MYSLYLRRKRPACVRIFFSVTLVLKMVVLGIVAPVQGQPSPPLTRDNAFLRTIENNPDLQIFAVQLRGAAALKQTAGQRPGFALEAEVENFGGSGDLQGFDASEQTLSLSSAIELGGKRAARKQLSDARAEKITAERDVKTLDLLADVTRTFVSALAAQERSLLARDEVRLAEGTLTSVRNRVEAGAAPEAEVLRARSSLVQAHLALAHEIRELDIRKMQLALLWNSSTVDFGDLQGNLFAFPAIENFDSLLARAEQSAALAIFADEERLKDLELQLARSKAALDIEWRFGVRRLEASGDTGLVAGMSVPLFSGNRAHGDVTVARAEREQAALQTQSARLVWRSQLFEAYQGQQQSLAVANGLRQEVIPTLTRALDETRQAYERGRYGYLDLAAAQRELLDARRAAIEAAATVLTQSALIEQLTGEPLVTSSSTRRIQENTQP
jgi:outer membrane protein, heavy metal efflux system